MKMKQKNYRTILIAESGILLAVLLAGGLLLLQNALGNMCREIQDEYVLSIHSYPDKLVYVAGQDTELDLTGGEICFSRSERQMNGFSCTLDDRSIDSAALCGHVADMRTVPYSTNVDFAVPNVYLVKFDCYSGSVSCAFPIEVIDPAALE